MCRRCRVVAPDLRCHGLTSTDGTDDAQELGFSCAVQAADVVAIWRALFACGGYSDDDGGNPARSGSRSSGATLEQQQQQQHAQQQHQEREARAHAADGGSTAELPPTVLVGHSMGGAFAVHAAALGGATQHSTAQRSIAWRRHTCIGDAVSSLTSQALQDPSPQYCTGRLGQKDVAHCCCCYEAPPIMTSETLYTDSIITCAVQAFPAWLVWW